MRFAAVWSQTLNQNVTLRFALIALSTTSLVLAACTVRLAVRDPILIERGCVSTAANGTSAKHTDREIDAFVREAIPRRFDSRTVESRVFLSVEELAFRQKEQQELKARGITQRVLVNETLVQGTSVKVDADRVLSTGNLRTAVAFALLLELAQTERTASNPYGLVITRVSPVKPKEESK